MAFVNLLLALTLTFALIIVARTGASLSNGVVGGGGGVSPPWSPVWEAVKPVWKRFGPEPLFSSDPSEKVDQAWKDLLKCE